MSISIILSWSLKPEINILLYSGVFLLWSPYCHYSFHDDIPIYSKMTSWFIPWQGHNSFRDKVMMHRVSEKTFNCLIWCKLKTTVFARAVFIFFKSSYFNLNFGIKQSKIGWKLAEQWLPKVKILEPVDDRRPDFFEKCINLRQSYCFNKIHWSVKNSWICKTHDCFT